MDTRIKDGTDTFEVFGHVVRQERGMGNSVMLGGMGGRRRGN